MAIDQKSFGKTLSSERKRLLLSVNQMANLCGVKAGSQYLYEKGNRLPNADYIDRAIAVGVTPELLLPSLKNSVGFSVETLIEALHQTDSHISRIRAELVKRFLDDQIPDNKRQANEKS